MRDRAKQRENRKKKRQQQALLDVRNMYPQGMAIRPECQKADFYNHILESQKLQKHRTPFI